MKVAVTVITLVVCLVVCSMVVLGEKSKQTTRELLSQKQDNLKTIKESVQQVETLLRADSKYASRNSIYGESKKNTKAELDEIQKMVQYEVDILSSLCSQQKGPNCDDKIVDKYSSEIVKGEIDSENIVVDVKFVDGSAAKTCKEYLKLDAKSPNGIYFIKPFEDEPEFKVFCDMKNGGYILFQRRVDGMTDFRRLWKDYADGFGDAKTSYWLGLKKISKFTKKYTSSLRVDLYHGTMKQTFNATYSEFSVDPEEQLFTLHVRGYEGNLGDSLFYHNGKKFSTTDKDSSKEKCPDQFKGAFWYEGCHYANLNGLYLKGKHESYADGMEWRTHGGYYYSYEKSAMGMIEN